MGHFSNKKIEFKLQNSHIENEMYNKKKCLHPTLRQTYICQCLMNIMRPTKKKKEVL